MKFYHEWIARDKDAVISERGMKEGFFERTICHGNPVS